MDRASTENTQSQSPPKRHGEHKRLAVLIAGALVLYLLAAYVLVPAGWLRYSHRHPALDDVPGIAHTAAGIPGDPLNVALIGTQTEVTTIMLIARWYPADSLGLRSDLKIVADTVLKRPDDRAPVSSLYLWGAGRTWPSSSPWATIPASGTTSASGATKRPPRIAGQSGSGLPCTTNASVSAAPPAR